MESKLSRIFRSRHARITGAVSTGLLLFCAFPPLAWHDAAWVALAPLIAIAIHTRPKVAFGWGWLSGIVFWLPATAWLLRLSVTGYPPVPFVLIMLGWLALAAYCALYVGVFAMIASNFFNII